MMQGTGCPLQGIFGFGKIRFKPGRLQEEVIQSPTLSVSPSSTPSCLCPLLTLGASVCSS